MDPKNFGDTEVRLPGTPADRAAEAMQEMKQEVGKYVNRAQDYVEDAKDRVQEFKDEAKDRVEDFVTDAKKQGQRLAGQAEDACASLDEYAHKNPWTVAAVAAGIGALIALCCRPPRD